MNKDNIKRLIKDLDLIGIPDFPENSKELQKIWDALILDHSDYISWEGAFSRNEFDKKTAMPEICIDEYLNQRIRNFKPTTDEEKKCLAQIKAFKDKMDEIVKELLKD
ncbi:hypothetical protein HYW21_05860 [Candidatus Woesearchaeota archaeon]|nr:hypothetical protein [Candidatus Woesearchaeota archaeon]